MEKYLIVTDTTSAMDQEIAQKNGIELISLSVIVDGHEYKIKSIFQLNNFMTI